MDPVIDISEMDSENDHGDENDGSLSPGYVSRRAGLELAIAPNSGMVGL